jgi:hypothetical protein
VIGAFAAAGFLEPQITHRFDPFQGTRKERTARKYGVAGVNISAGKR